MKRAEPGPGIDFLLPPEGLQRLFREAQEKMDLRLKGILEVPEAERTFENTLGAFEEASADFGDAVNVAALLSYVSPDAPVREAALKVQEDADRYCVGLSMREDLYRAVKDYAAKREPLSGEERKLLEDTLRDYKKNGMELPPQERETLRKIKERVVELQTRFEQNIQDHKDHLELPASELAGLPQDYVDGLEKTADGKYIVTLDYPGYMPFMKYAASAEHRRALQVKFHNRAAEKNVAVLQEALELRHETARMVGFASYAHLAISDRMAKEPERVWAFINRLKDLLTAKGEKELAVLLERKRRDEPKAERLDSWDLAYYSEKLRMETFDLDANEVKEYFPVDAVIEGTMRIYQRLLGLRFNELKAHGSWHPDARLFEIHDVPDHLAIGSGRPGPLPRTRDAQTGRRLGHFLLDLYPRQGKYTHMGVLGVISGRELDGGRYNEPLAVMMGNFTKPTKEAPSLLRHSEVETFFHEFGHVMHDTLTTVRYASHTRVARDFVEAPSQMMEDFVWEREVIDELSGHWREPSRKLPEALFKKMLAAKNFNKALGYLGQISYAVLDMTYHGGVPDDTTRLYREIVGKISLLPVEPGTHPQASFGHLLGGYGAGYYGYLWSEVFAKDIFSRFKREGLLSPKVGMEYRRAILARGSAGPEAQSLRDFLGREPSEEAFLEEILKA